MLFRLQFEYGIFIFVLKLRGETNSLHISSTTSFSLDEPIVTFPVWYFTNFRIFRAAGMTECQAERTTSGLSQLKFLAGYS